MLKGVIDQLNAQENQRTEVGALQLKLRAVYPEMPLDIAHNYGAQMEAHFSQTDYKAIIRDHAHIFPEDFNIVTMDLLEGNLHNLRTARYDDRLRLRILKCYDGAGGSTVANASQVSQILHQLLVSAGGDRTIVDKSLEMSLPSSVEEAVELMEELDAQGMTLPLNIPDTNTQTFAPVDVDADHECALDAEDKEDRGNEEQAE